MITPDARDPGAIQVIPSAYSDPETGRAWLSSRQFYLIYCYCIVAIRAQDVFCNELFLLYESFESEKREKGGKCQAVATRLIRASLGPCGRSGDWWVQRCPGPGPARRTGPRAWLRLPRPLNRAIARYTTVV